MADSLTARTRSTREQRGWYWYDWANTRFELSELHMRLWPAWMRNLALAFVVSIRGGLTAMAVQFGLHPFPTRPVGLPLGVSRSLMVGGW